MPYEFMPLWLSHQRVASFEEYSHEITNKKESDVSFNNPIFYIKINK